MVVVAGALYIGGFVCLIVAINALVRISHAFVSISDAMTSMSESVEKITKNSQPKPPQ